MNYALMPLRDNVALTRASVDSLLKQTVPTYVLLIDDGSTDGTGAWARTLDPHRVGYVWLPNVGVTRAWNHGLRHLFGRVGAREVLVVNNDTVFHESFFASLTRELEPLVSGISIREPAQNVMPPYITKSKHPDFSAFLLRREAWEKVGEFDPRFVNYCSDGCWHVRMHRAGLAAVGTNIPFLHFRSSTLNNADEPERLAFCAIADADRERFAEKYGTPMWGEGYDALFA